MRYVGSSRPWAQALSSGTERGTAHVGQDLPRAGSAEFCWDWVAARFRGRQPNCGQGSHSVFAASRPDHLPQRVEVPSLGPACQGSQANPGRGRGAADRAVELFLAPLQCGKLDNFVRSVSLVNRAIGIISWLLIPEQERETSSPSPPLLLRLGHNWGLLREVPVTVLPRVRSVRLASPLRRQQRLRVRPRRPKRVHGRRSRKSMGRP